MKNIEALTKNVTKGKFNFSLHIRDEHDIHFHSKDVRNEICTHIKQCYFSGQNRNLPIFGVPQEVELYTTTKVHLSQNKRAHLPNEKFRMRQEDIYEVLRGDRKSTQRMKKLLP